MILAPKKDGSLRPVVDRFPIPLLWSLLYLQPVGYFYSTGHFHFKSMPFGLRNSHITFSRLMAIIMPGLMGNTVFLYLDDMLIVSRDVAVHELKLK